MDLTNELILMKNSNIDNAIKHIEQQKDIWEQKLHVFNVINLVTELEKLRETDFFEKYEAAQLRVYSTHSNNLNKIRFSLHRGSSNNFDNQIVVIKGTEGYSQHKQITKLFHNLDDFNVKNIAQPFNIYLDVKESFKQPLLNMLLSDELGKILEHSEMHVEVAPKENVSKSKKPKI